MYHIPRQSIKPTQRGQRVFITRRGALLKGEMKSTDRFEQPDCQREVSIAQLGRDIQPYRRHLCAGPLRTYCSWVYDYVASQNVSEHRESEDSDQYRINVRNAERELVSGRDKDRTYMDTGDAENSKQIKM